MKKFSLGTELTKNEQKKVLGGWAMCSNGFYNSYLTCSNGPAYCAATGRGSMVGCG